MSASIVTSSPDEVNLIKSVIKVLAAEDKPLTPEQIGKRLGFKGNLISVLRRNPGIFECFLDGKLFVKLVTNVGVCEAHCARTTSCPGTIPICTGLHVCKYYILSGICEYPGQCKYGHDLTTPHNQQILRDNFLDGLSVQDLKKLLKTTTGPKICKYYNLATGCRNKAAGKSCPYLHICKSYVEGSCQRGRNCRTGRSHDILDAEVKAILEKHGINARRRPKEILADLREAMSESESGSTGSASLLDDFAGLQTEACGGRFSQEEYNQVGHRGRTPERQAGKPPAGPAKHSFTPNGKKSSANDPVPSLPRPRASSHQRSPRPRSPSDGQVAGRQISTDGNPCQQICIFNLRGKCAFAENCRNFHSDLPYQWLYKEVTQEQWQVSPQDENLGMELSFSDPKNQEYYMCLENNVGVKVTFKTLTGVDGVGHNFDVCRLSTSSSVEFENQPLTTVWLWYWKDPTDEWKMYGESDAEYKSDSTSTEFEQAYLDNPEGQREFSTLGQKYMYVLDFQHMLQRNMKYKTEKEVCRRPQFVSKQDVEEKKQLFKQGGHRKATGAGIASVNPPPLWNIQAGQDLLDHCILAPLRAEDPLTEKEYKEIEALFCESLPSTVSIKSIERIENGDLWSNYVSKKMRMVKKNGGKDVEERRLFHGTPSKYVHAICRQGFDYRLSGQTSDPSYGKGSYFATTAKYSNCFTDQRDKAILVVKVLVGEYTQGKKDDVRPPHKDPGDRCTALYDSCVDSVTKPSIFVIYDNNGQVYPEYLVKYKFKFSM